MWSMRSVIIVAIVCLLVLAASLAGCSSTPSPTATSAPPTAEPTNGIIPADNVLGTLAATVGAPLPGTLVMPDQETPDAPTSVAIDNLYFTQSGGIAGISRTIELRSDGTLIRDGEISMVSAENVQQITDLINSIHFFNLQGIFTGPGSAADAYRYSLTVNAPNGSRTITSEDGMTPPELYKVYDAILGLNQSS